MERTKKDAYSNEPFKFNDPQLIVPHNNELEKNVLGLMINDKEACSYGLQNLSEDSFPNIDNDNRTIFRAISLLFQKNVTVDFLTVLEQLESMKAKNSVGGFEYLHEITDSAFAYSAIKDYCLRLEDYRLLRESLRVLDQRLFEYKTKEIPNINDYIGQINADITEIAQKRRIIDFESTKILAKKLEEHMKQMARSGTGTLTGVNTGYSDLNNMTHGFQKGDFVIVAARPAVGKTAFALNLALNIAKLNQKTVGFFTVEMPSRQMMMRLVAAESNVNYQAIQTNHLSKVDMTKVKDGLNVLSAIPLYFDETPGIKVSDIVIKTRKLKQENSNLAAIVIDYIGLVTLHKKAESRQLEVSEVSRTLKELARELEITVIALSQLSREVEKRPSKRPSLSDLRESGGLEQDADVVMLMFREDYYVEQGTLKPKDSQYESYYNTLKEKPSELSPSLVDIMVAKNRNGEVGQTTLIFFKACSNFSEPDQSLRLSIRAMQDEFNKRKGTPE